MTRQQLLDAIVATRQLGDADASARLIAELETRNGIFTGRIAACLPEVGAMPKAPLLTAKVVP